MGKEEELTSLDFVINVLLEHEKALDEITKRLEKLVTRLEKLESIAVTRLETLEILE